MLCCGFAVRKLMTKISQAQNPWALTRVLKYLSLAFRIRAV